MRGGVAVVLSSPTDARSLLAVASELRARGIAVQVFVLGGPGSDAVRALARAAGPEPPVIGKDASLDATRLLRATHPVVVVIGADCLYFTARLIEAARKEGIRTVLVQEAANEIVPLLEVRKPLTALLRQPARAWFRIRTQLANRDAFSLFALAAPTLFGRVRQVHGYGFGDVDVFCVATERVGDAYRARGARARRIVATGIPELVPTIALQRVEYDYLLLTQPFDVGGFAPHGWKQAFFRNLVRVLRAVSPRARILCKVHPTEREDEYEDLGVTDFSNDLATAIACSDVVVSVHSAALCAAIANGRPAIAYVPPALCANTENMIVAEMSRLGLLVSEDDAFAALLRRLTHDRSSVWDPAAARAAFGPCLDGRAAQRVADLVEAETSIAAASLGGRSVPIPSF